MRALLALPRCPASRPTSTPVNRVGRSKASPNHPAFRSSKGSRSNPGFQDRPDFPASPAPFQASPARIQASPAGFPVSRDFQGRSLPVFRAAPPEARWGRSLDFQGSSLLVFRGNLVFRASRDFRHRLARFPPAVFRPA